MMIVRQLNFWCAVILMTVCVAAASAERWVYDHSNASRIDLERTENGIFGSVPTNQSSGEVVVEQHVLEDGQAFDLPTWPSDGTQAEEHEIFWTVMLENFHLRSIAGSGWLRVSFSGRTAVFENQAFYPDLSPPTVRVTVVAVRKEPPVPTTAVSISKLKHKYRDEDE